MAPFRVSLLSTHTEVKDLACGDEGIQTACCTKKEMKNQCYFSDCRRWRYSLLHRFDDQESSLFGVLSGDGIPEKILPWIGLNPSTADEQQLDPTLRRVASFSKREGYDGFVMLNLFAWRDTKPEDMMRQVDPVGRDNDEVLKAWAKKAGRVVCAWGNHGGYMSRWRKVAGMLQDCGAELLCLGTNADGSPKHPLYVKGDSEMAPWKIPPEVVDDPWTAKRRRRAIRKRERYL